MASPGWKNGGVRMLHYAYSGLETPDAPTTWGLTSGVTIALGYRFRKAVIPSAARDLAGIEKIPRFTRHDIRLIMAESNGNGPS